MRVGIVSSSSGLNGTSDYPGVGRYVATLGRALQAQGIDVRIIVPSAYPRVEKRYLDGIEEIHVPDLRAKLGQFARVGQLSSASFGIMLGTHPDVLSDLDILQTDLPLFLGWEKIQTPALGFVHHVERMKRLQDIVTVPFGNAWMKASLLALPAWATPSHATALAVRTEWGIPLANTWVIHHGIDLDVFAPSEPADAQGRGSTLLCIGPLQERKRTGLAIDCLALLVRERSDIRLVIVGEGPERARLERRALALGVQSHIRFVGGVGDRELIRLYQGAALLLCTSRLEGFGLTLAEALACGTPVVAFEQAVTQETLGDVGTLVPEGRVDLLSEAVGRLLDNPERMNELREGSIERATRLFDAKRMALEYIALYRRLAS